MKIYRYQCLWESTEIFFRDTIKMTEKLSNCKEEVESFGMNHVRELVGEETWNDCEYSSYESNLAELIELQLEVAPQMKYAGPLYWKFDEIEV